MKHEYFTQAEADFSTREIREMDKATNKILEFLTAPRNQKSARDYIDRVVNEAAIAPTCRWAISDVVTSKLKSVQLDWQFLKKDFRHIVSVSSEVDPVELGMGFFNDGYICCGSALYWNELTNQVPHHYYIASERKSPQARRPRVKFAEYDLRTEFLKDPRKTSKVATHGHYTYTLLERSHSGGLGVTEKRFKISGRQSLMRITNIERTLLDCTIYPHYSGGIATVLDAYATAGRKLSLNKLIQYYKSLNLIYPYWQRIGLILEKQMGEKRARNWKTEFGRPRYRFYIDRPAKADWVVNERWNVAYPAGLF